MTTTISSAEPYIPSLKSLPPEIRDQIWLLCLAPRTIQLHTHHHEKLYRKKLSAAKRFTKPPPRFDSKNHVPGCVRIPRPRATRAAGISFTATLVEEGKSPQFYMNEEECTKSCPVAPALLHVCRESRAIVLERYELIFPGKSCMYEPNKPTAARKASEKAWVERHLGPSRIWFDFSRDTLLLHFPSKIGVLSYRTLAPLNNLVYYAKDELHRIENLAVGLTNARALARDQPGYYGNQDFERSIMSFTSLRDLTIYDLSQGMYEPSLTGIPPPHHSLPATIEEMTTHLVSTLSILRDSDIYRRQETIKLLNENLQGANDVDRAQQVADFKTNWPETPPQPHLTVLRISKL